MNTEERILTALRCEEPDRVPVVVYLNPYTSNWVTNDRSYRRLLEATREYADVIYDAYFTLPLADDESRQTTDLGGGRTKESIQTPRGEIFRVLREHARGVEKHLVESAEDALKLLSIPQPGYEPDLSEFLRVRDELRGEAVAQVTLADPICIIGDSFSPEFLSLCTIAHRELLLELAETYFRRSTALLEYLLYNDAGPIYYFNGPEYALPPLMSPRDFDELVVAYDRELVRQVHERGKVAIVHSHGRVNDFLERFAEIAPRGLNVLEPPPHGDVILKDAKERVGGRMCLIGNIQYEEFARCSREQIERRVRDCIADAARGGGFILSPCAYPYESPIPERTSENFIHYLKMGRKYGQYPLSGTN